MKVDRHEEANMRRLCTIVGTTAALAGLACSDGPTIPAAEPPVLTLAELIVSDALSASMVGGPSGLDLVAYVSLPPGTIPEMGSVRIRNVTATGLSLAILLVDGGFDPVPVAGGAGDQLELTFTDENGPVSVAYATIPLRRPPTVVRTNPSQGPADVLLSVRPQIVFSEPIDPGTLADGLRLRTNGTEVEASVATLPERPWIAELTPVDALEPVTAYELHVTTAVDDLHGDGLEESVTTTFTTTRSEAEPPHGDPVALLEAAIAFVSDRDGLDLIYFAAVDGSGVTRGIEGSSPAWSRDGRRIAFTRGEASAAGPPGIYVLDGDGLRYAGPGSQPTWSPDGRIAFISGSGVYAMNADGSGVTLLVDAVTILTDWGAPLSWLPNYQIRGPAWSPDGLSIWFQAQAFGGTGTAAWSGGWRVGIADSDGSNPRELDALTDLGPQSRPAWSPDGSTIAIITQPGPWEWCDPWLGGCRPGPAFGESSVIYTYDIGPDLALGDRKAIYTHRAFLANGPDWSPDGSHVVFDGDFSPYGAPDASRIFAVSLETGEVRRLIPDADDPVLAEYRDWGAVWSPRTR
jgi:Tol biopolymer transport system component